MLCEKCGKKPAVVHMIAMVGDKQIKKWLCADCAKEYMPPLQGGDMGNISLLPKDAQMLLKHLFGEPKKVTKEGFSENLAKILELATKKTLELGNERIGTEHLLWGILNVEGCTARKYLEEAGMEPEQVKAELESWLEKGSKVGGIPEYSERAKIVLEKAASIAKRMRLGYVGSEQLLMGILQAGDGIACQVLNKFRISEEVIDKVVEALKENMQAVPGKTEPLDSLLEEESKPADVLEVLAQFGRNLNEAARMGKSDPVIGREAEVERITQILCRRTKNNPVIIGEAGVGKTAIAEALAQQIVKGQVPEFLENKIIFSLELGMLVAGAKYRGEFEERMKEILSLIKNDTRIILFIDELHTIIGAGSAEGSIDAANIIKPALARGELQIIGATTIDEYRKHVEKDAALERRFQPVLVETPTAAVCEQMLLGLKKRYEKFHGLTIEDSAISAAVKLSDRYINDRNLPDKAIDIMDEACARLRIKAYKLAVPAKQLREELEYKQLEKEEAVSKEKFEEAARLRDEEAQLQSKLSLALAQATMEEKVTEQEVAEVIASWTGIPLQKLTEKESRKLLELEAALHRRVIGQAEAVEAVSKAVRRARAGFKDKNRPVGSFLFLGPTGVGKTELAKALAAQLFGDERSMLRFDMSEYMEKHTASRLVGAPPGYVGYEEGGQLTDAIRHKPYSVVLLDEIEKAHPDIFNLLLQIMEDGRLTDGQGRTVDFRNAVLIMTSNAGAHQLSVTRPLGFAADLKAEQKNRKNQVLGEIKHLFRPEFLNRIDEILVFDALGPEELRQIANNLVAELNVRLKENGLELEMAPSALELLLKEGSDAKYGARPLRRALRKLVEDPVSDLFLAGQFAEGDRIIAEDNGDGQLKFHKALEAGQFLLEVPLNLSRDTVGVAKGE